jgi:protein-tyrosine-phosphatase
MSLDAHFVLRDAGIDIPRETGATDLKVQRHLVSAADVILVMTEEQRRMLAANFPEAAGKTVLTLRELAGEAGDIEDPATRDESFFRHTRDEIVRCLELGLDRLVADVAPTR